MTSLGSNGKAHIVEIFAAEAAHFKRDRTLGRRLSVGGVGETETHLLAGHRFDERVLGQGRRGAVRMCFASRRTVTVWQTS